MPALELVPIALDEACAFVVRHHRTHRNPRVIARFAVAAALGYPDCDDPPLTDREAT